MGSIIKYKGKVPQVGKRVFIAEGACLVGDVSIGDDSSVFYNAVLRADLAEIKIGKRTNIQDNVSVHVSTGVGVNIGDEVTVGHGAVLHGCNYHGWSPYHEKLHCRCRRSCDGWKKFPRKFFDRGISGAHR